jgi:hypothetical protein
MASTEDPSDDGEEAIPSGPSHTERRSQLERILASPTLQASPRRRLLLRYLAEETLDGRADRLKGYPIALAVFNRDQSFDPQFDPVVRLEARRLRRDLDGYYAGAGSHDRIRISIPRGGYVCQFEWMDGASGSPSVHSAATAEAPVIALSATSGEPDIRPTAIPSDRRETRDASPPNGGPVGRSSSRRS